MRRSGSVQRLELEMHTSIIYMRWQGSGSSFIIISLLKNKLGCVILFTLK